jgi:succinyl-CoA synthetase beta subunit
MKLHEYQAKELLQRWSIPVAGGIVAQTPEEAVAAAQKIDPTGKGPWVLKAQVHAGGRGKAGGVKLAKTLDEVRTLATQMIGMKLVTPQTGPQGKIVRPESYSGVLCKPDLRPGCQPRCPHRQR